MLNEARSNEPLTHAALLSACYEPVEAGCQARQWVQVQRRFKGRFETLCGHVLEAGAGAKEWFYVRTPIGDMWFEGRDVRLCSGDGRCTCNVKDFAVVSPC